MVFEESGFYIAKQTYNRIYLEKITQTMEKMDYTIITKCR